MTDQVIKEILKDSEIYQSTVDDLIDEMHELVSKGNLTTAKNLANRIREFATVGQ